MRVWTKLFAMICIVFGEFVLAMMPHPPDEAIYVHVTLGIIVAAIAAANFATMRHSDAPERVKRGSGAIVPLAALMPALGLLLLFDVGEQTTLAWNVSARTLILVAYAILATTFVLEAAAVAITFDWWESNPHDAAPVSGVRPSAGPRSRAG